MKTFQPELYTQRYNRAISAHTGSDLLIQSCVLLDYSPQASLLGVKYFTVELTFTIVDFEAVD